MPTGYTADIKNGITFEKFVMNCARAFGACLPMRDDPQGTTIPDKFEPSDYHPERLKEIHSELNKIDEITEKEAETFAQQEYENEIERCRKYIEEYNKLEDQYRTMLSKVKAWQPPTEDHIELKKFMIEQINSSIKFDCSTKYYIKKLEEIKPLTGIKWLDKERKILLKDLDYHSREWTKEKERINGRNEWVKQLRESLK
jgi:hypothetical protein